jgi:hypothetical protein
MVSTQTRTQWSSIEASPSVRHPVEVVRRKLIEEITQRRATRRHSIAAEGTRRALQAGLDAKPLIFEAADGTGDAILHVANRGTPLGGGARFCFHVATAVRATLTADHTECRIG